MSEIVKKTMKELLECRDKHDKLVKEKGHPYFAPKSGTCWKCNRNIYQNYIIGERESKGETGDIFITGCPHCYRSYCD
jgi:hypothetical protein